MDGVRGCGGRCEESLDDCGIERLVHLRTAVHVVGEPFNLLILFNSELK